MNGETMRVLATPYWLTPLLVVGCGAPERGGAALSVEQLARVEMLVEMSRQVEGSFGLDEPAEAICVAAGMGQDSDFDVRAGRAGDPASIAKLREADPRFAPAASCTVTDTWVVRSESGAAAHMYWTDSISSGADRRIWGTVVVAPGLGKTRGYVCTVVEPTPGTVELNDCRVSWFN
jgi:hypothetical protein